MIGLNQIPLLQLHQLYDTKAKHSGKWMLMFAIEIENVNLLLIPLVTSYVYMCHMSCVQSVQTKCIVLFCTKKIHHEQTYCTHHKQHVCTHCTYMHILADTSCTHCTYQLHILHTLTVHTARTALHNCTARVRMFTKYHFVKTMCSQTSSL